MLAKGRPGHKAVDLLCYATMDPDPESDAYRRGARDMWPSRLLGARPWLLISMIFCFEWYDF